MNSTRTPYSVLVVDDRPLVAARLVEPLRDAGYDVIVATTFEAAKQRLAARPPNLLIAASHLGLFNGLHLVVRGHLDYPEMSAILTADTKDPVLEAEASTYGARASSRPKRRHEPLGQRFATVALQPIKQ